MSFERCALFGESFIGDSSICYTVCGISGQKVKTSYSLYSCPLLESQKNVVWDVLLCPVYSETLYLIFLQGCYLWFLSFPLLMLVAMVFTEYWRHKASMNTLHLSPVCTDHFYIVCYSGKGRSGTPILSLIARLSFGST